MIRLATFTYTSAADSLYLGNLDPVDLCGQRQAEPSPQGRREWYIQKTML